MYPSLAAVKPITFLTMQKKTKNVKISQSLLSLSSSDSEHLNRTRFDVTKCKLAWQYKRNKNENKTGQAFLGSFPFNTETRESCNMKSKSTLHQIIFATFQISKSQSNKQKTIFCILFYFLSLFYFLGTKLERPSGFKITSFFFVVEVAASDRPLVRVEPDFNKAAFSDCYIFDLF